MQNNSPVRKRIQIKTLGLYASLFIIVILYGHAGLQKHSSINSEKTLYSTKNKNAKSLVNVNDMLFSIMTFSLYDVEDSDNP